MTMLQIRNVPEDLHRRLKSKAALQGMSLSEFALAELARAADRPTRGELLERMRTRAAVSEGPSSVEIVREERDSR